MQNRMLEILQNKKIAVLCGGVGTEVEVSLDSGNAIFQALKSKKLEVAKIVADGSEKQIAELECDLVFIALHGEYGEDGTVQQQLENRGIPFTGSKAETSRVCMDKNATKEKFVENSIPVAPWICVENTEALSEKISAQNILFPVVVKPNSGGSSVGVYIVKEQSELVDKVKEVLKYDRRVMIEQYVAGVELTSSVLGGKALPLIELKAEKEFYDYYAKYEAETTIYECPPKNVSEQVIMSCSKYSTNIFKEFNLLDMARVDYICTCCADIVALEINTIPGFTSHSLLPKAAQKNGVAFAELCVEIAGMAYQREVLNRG